LVLVDRASQIVDEVGAAHRTITISVAPFAAVYSQLTNTALRRRGDDRVVADQIVGPQSEHNIVIQDRLLGEALDFW